MFCKNCGKEIADDADICTNCGCFVKKGSTANSVAKENVGDKSRIVSGLLGIFLGGIGAHNFYLRRWANAIIQLVMSICAFVLMIAGTVNMASEAVNRGWTGEITEAQATELLDMFGTYFYIGYVMLLVVGIWVLVEAILCFCGVIKDGKGKKLK